ncbi:MFS transporter [Rathayibacter rathayi]|uniref:MFS transporter n=1 Tax=Rathayibacter rathayi TaxID=33887 RepID=UPI000BC80B31|nr:MFS transporter [Rathayibacter rathayi]AZZ49137.1 MFS transporter [Rathayibacter rathayi]MWV73190.1 MFS transporter [Rathayibacter rathayi NCPPB 2980 = VKM Ac-1601]PPF83466.1 MFS transporter [Rathayibacter rathayi]PPG16267.1 MFS transporter [Rathayibacter rathayi]PPG47286.1 MFS transporter [Rathayibacter rathayi]
MTTGHELKQRTRQAPYVVVAAALGITLAASGAPSPAYADFQGQWSLPTSAVTVAYAVYALGVIAALLTAGGISDRIGTKPVLVAGMLTLALSMVGLALAPNLPVLILARLIQGVATGISTGAAGAALSETHPRSDQRAAAGTNSIVSTLGIAAGAVGSGAVLDWGAPLALPFEVLAGASLLTALGVALLSPRTDRAPGARLFALQRPSVPRGMRRDFLVASFCVTAAWSVGGLYLALGGSLARSLLGVHGHVVAGIVVLAVQGVGGAVQVLWTLMAASVPPRRAATYAMLALGVGTATTAAGAVLASAPLAVAGAVLSGAGFGLSFLTGTRIVTLAAPAPQLGAVLAAYFVLAYVALSAPALGVGFLAAAIGDGAAFVLFASAIIVLCAAALVLLRPRSRADRSASGNAAVAR